MEFLYHRSVIYRADSLLLLVRRMQWQTERLGGLYMEYFSRINHNGQRCPCVTPSNSVMLQ